MTMVDETAQATVAQRLAVAPLATAKAPPRAATLTARLTDRENGA